MNLVVILTWFDLPKVFTSGAVSNGEAKEFWSKRTTKVRPPLKSTPSFKPLVAKENTPNATIKPEMMYARLRFAIKVNEELVNNPSVSFEANLIDFFEAILDSNTNRVKKMAANKDVIIPIIKVVAKPLIGPVPKV